MTARARHVILGRHSVELVSPQRRGMLRIEGERRRSELEGSCPRTDFQALLYDVDGAPGAQYDLHLFAGPR